MKTEKEKLLEQKKEINEKLQEYKNEERQKRRKEIMDSLSDDESESIYLRSINKMFVNSSSENQKRYGTYYIVTHNTEVRFNMLGASMHSHDHYITDEDHAAVRPLTQEETVKRIMYKDPQLIWSKIDEEDLQWVINEIQKVIKGKLPAESYHFEKPENWKGPFKK